MANDFSENEFPIYTNNFDVKINRENVGRNFTIFQIGTSEKYFKQNVLDILTDDISLHSFKAQSVAYYRHNRWFAMFKKEDVSFDDFKAKVQEIDESAIVNKVDLYEKNENSRTSIKDVELAQLLVNSLANSRSGLFSYNNITGSLYYPFERKQNAKKLEFLKLRFFCHDNGIIALEADTETFSETETRIKYGKPDAQKNYVFDDDTGKFRKKLKSDNGKKLKFYDKGDLTRKGSRNKFLDFSSNDNFENSKVGIIARFLKDVKDNLDRYIKISQIPITRYKSHDSRTEYENKNYKPFLLKKGVCVVDTVKTAESKSMKEKIVDYLKWKYGLSEISDKREKGKYIIEIIHDKDAGFYATKEEEQNPPLFEEFQNPKDQHNLFTQDEIIQHITVENSAEKIGSEALENVMEKIAQELIIKGDLHDRQISLVNWSEHKIWTFAKCGRGQWNDSKGCYDFIYYKMKISQSGKIEIETFDARNFPDPDSEWGVLDRIFRKYNTNNRKQISDVECVVFENLEDINVIYKTKQFTLPNTTELADKIAKSDGKNKICKSKIKKFLDEYVSAQPLTSKEKDELAKIYQTVEKAAGNEISYKDILTSKSDESKMQSLIKFKSVVQFVDWLDKNHGILLHPQPKSGGNLQKNFGSFLGVKSTEFNGTFKYFVGNKIIGKSKTTLKQSRACSCVIRDVIPWNRADENPSGAILFEQIAHMLEVEFVRNGEFTVLPFPVKYLNEYERLCSTCFGTSLPLESESVPPSDFKQ